MQMRCSDAHLTNQSYHCLKHNIHNYTLSMNGGGKEEGGGGGGWVSVGRVEESAES